MSNDRVVFNENKEERKQQIWYTSILKSTFKPRIRFCFQVVIIKEGVPYQSAA
jgi:hypothetical protein